MNGGAAQAAEPQTLLVGSTEGGVVPAPSSVLHRCRCGVWTTRPLCYFCTRTEEQRRHIPRRGLTLTQKAAIRSSAATVPQLASMYGVSERTIWRVLAQRPEKFSRIEVAGYHAEFEVTEDGPRQRTGWRANSG